MHIFVTCPRCQSVWRVEPNLRGRQMRCPNAVCRAIFEVKEEELPGARSPEPPPPRETSPPAPASQVSGSVGEMVPILSAEALDHPPAPPVSEPVAEPTAPSTHVQQMVPVVTAEMAAEPKLSPPPAWEKMAPPVRRSLPAPKAAPPPGSPVDKQAPQEITEPDDFLSQVPEDKSGASSEGTQELAAGTWEAPPVRRPTTDGALLPQESVLTYPESVLSSAAVEHAARRGARRRAGWMIAVLVVLMAGVVGGILWMFQGRLAETEADGFKKAVQLYDDRNFTDAMTALQNLHRDFPDSKNRARYLFLKELSALRDPVYYPQGEDKEAVDASSLLLKFLRDNQDDPRLSSYKADIWHTLQKSTKELTSWADQKKDRRLLNEARKALAESGKYQPAEAQAREARRQLEAALAQAERHIAVAESRQALIERVQQLARQPSAESVQKARALVLEAGMSGDGELQNLLQGLVKGHAASVTYTPVTVPAPEKLLPSDQEPSFLIAPLLRKAASFPDVEARPIFALVRGVLYALSPSNGQVRWFRRVGVDTTLLPLRLAASPIAPEIALVLSSDRKSLAALDAGTGNTIWEHPLQDPCLGQPVLAGNRILAPTYSGRVDEIETSAGQLQGYYQLGQRLTVGGVRQQGTALAYFPADSFTVYILDVARRTCAGVLYSGHPRGSLRSAPVVLADPATAADSSLAAGGVLLLSQAEAAGGDAVKLRAFKLKLPIINPDQPSLPPELSVRGWSWFPPYHDGERLALATDAGVFALYGIRQKGNDRDPFLFPLLKEEVHLASETSTRFGRSQIVHADPENFWVLAHGRLERLQLTFTRQSGPDISHRWPETLSLGSPLHAAQVHEGSKTLFLVTQSRGGPTCHITAVDAQVGRLFWQRQLGLVCQGQLHQVGDHVLAQDPSGVFLFDAADYHPGDDLWQPGGSLILANSPEAPATNLVLPADKGTSAYILSIAGTTLKVLHFQPGQKKRPVDTHKLPARLAGSPALGNDCLVLPLANGILERLSLADGVSVHGPNWRAAGAEDQAPGFVVSLGDADFLTTNGSRGLTWLHWPKANWDKKGSTQLSSRIIAPPVVLFPVGKEQKIRVCVADAADTLTLLEGENLVTARSWRMPGKITAGPFVRGGGIGCVVGKNQLIWIDPDKEEPVWKYGFVAEIVGQPQLVDGMLVVANLEGQFLALDPAIGRPLGPGYTLRANVAPAAAPVAFATDRLFAPLSDGTVMLLSRKLLR